MKDIIKSRVGRMYSMYTQSTQTWHLTNCSFVVLFSQVNAEPCCCSRFKMLNVKSLSVVTWQNKAFPCVLLFFRALLWRSPELCFRMFLCFIIFLRNIFSFYCWYFWLFVLVLHHVKHSGMWWKLIWEETGCTATHNFKPSLLHITDNKVRKHRKVW